ncbi:MAG: amidohydrolase family protein [Gemmatimonadales bacterium]
MILRTLSVLSLAATGHLAAQAPRQVQPAVARYVSVNEPVVALTNVRLIDGTGRPARAGQTVVITGDRISAVGPAGSTTIPAGARQIDLAGHTIMPGIIGLHDHMYYSSAAGGSMKPMLQSYPRLFLSAGVTTIRTTGSVDSYQELNLKRSIAEGEQPGPDIFVTGPYLQGPGPGPGAMHALAGPEDAARLVRYWSEEGVSWFKAYTQISRAELGAAITEAHKHGVKVTGHLCSVGFREAVALGIDNLEHGFLDNLEYFPGKQPDKCPTDFATQRKVYGELDINGADVQRTFREMIDRGVSMTSTLAVIELGSGRAVPRDPRVLAALFPAAAATVDSFYTRTASQSDPVLLKAFKNGMAFERAFVAAGGLLGAGSDPCCLSAIAGYADHRNYQLLVEAGFTPEQAVQIMTQNGAKILGIADRVGAVRPGQEADLVVLQGDLTSSPDVIRNVVTVYKRGLGYDAAKLTAAIKGLVGLR